MGAGGWLLAVVGGYAASRAISALTYDFGLPGQAGYEVNQQIIRQFGSGGGNAPILLVVGNGRQQVPAASAISVVQAGLTQQVLGTAAGPL